MNRHGSNKQFYRNVEKHHRSRVGTVRVGNDPACAHQGDNPDERNENTSFYRIIMKSLVLYCVSVINGQTDQFDHPSDQQSTNCERLMTPDFLAEAHYNCEKCLPPIPESRTALPVSLVQITDDGIVVWAASEVAQQPCSRLGWLV